MKTQTLFKGTLILMTANIINRFLGFLLRMILVRLVGAEGLGLFQMAYPIYTTLLLLCTAGFPVAIAKLIPEELVRQNQQEVAHYLVISLLFVGFFSLIIAIALGLVAEFVAVNIFAEIRLYFLLLTIAPGLLFSSLAAVLRGYFQGHRNMIPVGVSQSIEQLNRFLLTTGLLILFTGLSLRYKTAIIGLGVTVGELSGLLILIWLFYRYHPDKKCTPGRIKVILTIPYINVLRKIGRLAVPITTGKFINSLMWSAEAVLIPLELRNSGLTGGDAASLYGQLSGLAEPIIYLPTVIMMALTTNLIPSVSTDFAGKKINEIKKTHLDVLRISTYIGILVSTILLIKGNEICQLLYKLPETGSILAMFGTGAVFIYYYHVSNGILNGLGKPNLILVNMSIGSTIKIMLILILISRLQYKIYGAVIAIIVNYLVSSGLNFWAIGRLIGFKIKPWQTIIKPLIGGLIIFQIQPYQAKFIQHLSLTFPISLVLNLITMTAVYLLFLLLVRAITPADLKGFWKN